GADGPVADWAVRGRVASVRVRAVDGSPGRMERFSVSERRSLRPQLQRNLFPRAWLGFCESSRTGGHTADFHRHSKERYRLSFFDEVDEPPRPEPRTRTTSRAGSRARRPSGPGGGSRRPPGDQQAIQVRRAVAIVAIIVVIVLVAVGVHSCQVSATNSALQDYTNSVSSLNQQSVANGKQLFTALSEASGASSVTNVQQQINQVLHDEQTILKKAKGASVPDQVKSGNADFVMALQ